MSNYKTLDKLKNEYPSFTEVFSFGKFKKLLNAVEEMRVEVENGEQIDSGLCDDFCEQIKSEGLQEFAKRIWYALYKDPTIGAVINRRALGYYDEICKMLISKYGRDTVKREMGGIFQGSKKLEMDAQLFYMYHIGKTYNCQFSKIFGGNKDIDIYIEEHGLGIEITSRDLDNIEINGITEEYEDEDGVKCKIEVGNIDHDIIVNSIIRAEEHLSCKIKDSDIKYKVCALSLPMKHIHQCSEILYQEMIPRQQVNANYYYMLHDPRDYIGPLLYPGFDLSFIHFIFSNHLENISDLLIKAFSTYQGTFCSIPVPCESS